VQPYTEAFAMIDRELSFLRYLRANRIPCIEVLSILADAAPRGARFESLSINRRGELMLRGKMANTGQLGDFRSELVASGFFSQVVVEEQSPAKDRRSIMVRLRAAWTPGRGPALPR
jgi:hypothetical protein